MLERDQWETIPKRELPVSLVCPRTGMATSLAREAREGNDVTAWDLRSNLPAATHRGHNQLSRRRPGNRSR